MDVTASSISWYDGDKRISVASWTYDGFKRYVFPGKQSSFSSCSKARPLNTDVLVEQKWQPPQIAWERCVTTFVKLGMVQQV